MTGKIAVSCQFSKRHSATNADYSGCMAPNKTLDVFLENVGRLMEHRGISKIELGRMAARRGNYAPRTITSALNREFRSPAFGVCADIADALGVPMALLVIPGARLEVLDLARFGDLVAGMAQVQPDTLAFIKSVIERDLKD